MTRVRLAVCAALAFTIATCSSDKLCTQIGCYDNEALLFSVVNATANDLIDGDYTIRFTTDTWTDSINCSVKSGQESLCQGSNHVMGSYGACDEFVTDCKCPSSFRCLNFELGGGTKTLLVEVSRDGTTLVQRSVTPQYGRDYPNGPDCDRGCATAKVSPDLIQL